MIRSISLALLLISQTYAFADQQSDAHAVEALFQKQSEVVFSPEWHGTHQTISLVIDGCIFTLRNERYQPDAARGSYVETSVFDLALVDTRADRAIAQANKFAVSLTWMKQRAEFDKTLEIVKRLMAAAIDARHNLDASGARSLQSLADMSERLWSDALAGPDGGYIRRGYTVREAFDRARDPRRVYVPLLGFRLLVRPEDHADLVNAVDQYATLWCQP